MRKGIIFISLLYAVHMLAQPNCEAFKYYGDDSKYQACKVAEKRAGHYQFSREYQEAFDEALLIDSTFAFAYQAKSTAYLKSGDFITWKALMDKAVRYTPKEQLGYRAWCRYQFFRDYEGTIEDIELLDSLVEHNIGYSVNGHYHLHIARALCYKAIGKPQKAIKIIEQQLQDSTLSVGLFDYLHLGVLYLEARNYTKAVEILKIQEQENDLAENRFYIALAYKNLGKPEYYVSNLKIAKDKYLNGLKMYDAYVEQMDKIYLNDIESALKTK